MSENGNDMPAPFVERRQHYVLMNGEASKMVSWVRWWLGGITALIVSMVLGNIILYAQGTINAKAIEDTRLLFERGSADRFTGRDARLEFQVRDQALAAIIKTLDSHIAKPCHDEACRKIIEIEERLAQQNREGRGLQR